ncbi:hypothetical protein GCM10009414_17540 [Tatumella terrea]
MYMKSGAKVYAMAGELCDPEGWQAGINPQSVYRKRRSQKIMLPPGEGRQFYRPGSIVFQRESRRVLFIQKG